MNAKDTTIDTVKDVTVSINEEKKGIEIRFAKKPAAEVLAKLKGNGWRWSRFSNCWYTKKSDSALEFAHSITL